MKRANWWMGLAVAAGLALVCATAAGADYSETVGGVTWSYDLDEGCATVMGADPAEGNLKIPSSLGSCPVTSIGKWAFGCSGLTSVTIPAGVTSIGEQAFSVALT